MSSGNDPSRSMSRRQRLFDMGKNLKDVYIPTFQSTITQLASEATNRALNYNDVDSNIPNKNYQGANIILYPHFTRQSEDGKSYYTQVHGWVYAKDGSSRKKRIIISLARQLCKSNNPVISDATAGQLDEQINSIQENDSSSDSSSIMTNSTMGSTSSPTSPVKRSGTASSSSSNFHEHPPSSSSSNYDTDEILKERIASFVNRSIGNLELNIAIGGSNRHELKTLKILTDNNGNFNMDVITKFKPSYVQVAVSEDEKIFEFKDVMFPGESKFGIISDIDDTIKQTGVCGDKRKMFRNTFVDDMSTWEVPGVADFYRFLHQKYDVSFFYVSNSPYQLYSNLMKFFNMFEFPKGAIYLKRYTGNILNSFMEPSHSRKKAPLERIISHFSNRKFFLIGDTSEQDLEAYVDIARLYPDNIAGIYLRVAPNSMNLDTLKLVLEILSKKNINDKNDGNDLTDKINELKEINEEISLIDLNNEDDIKSKEQISIDNLNKIKQNSNLKSNEVIQDLIDLDEPTSPSPPQSIRKQPPKIPRKPNSLRVEIPPNETTLQARGINPTTNYTNTSPSSSSGSSSIPPSLPRRPIPNPPPTAKSKLSSIASKTLHNAKSFNSDVPFDDETNDEWISRIITSLIILKNSSNDKIKIKFFNDIDEIHQDIQEIMNK
ncbi:Actin patch protein 1 [Wickerhamomyces ciferrii]|uniref:Actin patch protein 1 n=1 Tax=Wickerhamomyces ciferrii (strain ATCC 14091 / BCRC 22168 / CBS 111 / JCM 3599 / NBRC 0793 / NRRL Y-1031 F-60-10) TaxID=1206466 RepID=K0KIU9_WICCF|nr:Actin patch protein 1 [Wickerhamomyces ciferrii]CCH41068.1 Actin patch protein 1 [Wickerhamomyces ciferrii]